MIRSDVLAGDRDAHLPDQVPRASYRGSDTKKQAKAANHDRIAARIEDHINSELASAADDTIHTFYSDEIAQDLGEDSKTVHDVVYSIHCGSHGVTIVKGDLDRAFSKTLVEQSHETNRQA